MPEAIGLIGLGELGAEGALGAEALFGAEAATGAAELGTGALIGAEEGAALGAAELGPGIGFGAEGIDLTGLGAESFLTPGVEVGDITGVGSAQFGSGFLPGGNAIAQGPIVGAEGFAAPTSVLGDPLAPSVGGPLSPIGSALDTTGTIASNEGNLALSENVDPLSFGRNFGVDQFGTVSQPIQPGMAFSSAPDFTPMPGEDFLTSSGPMSQFQPLPGTTGAMLDPTGLTDPVFDPTGMTSGDINQALTDDGLNQGQFWDGTKWVFNNTPLSLDLTQPGGILASPTPTADVLPEVTDITKMEGTTFGNEQTPIESGVVSPRGGVLADEFGGAPMSRGFGGQSLGDLQAEAFGTMPMGDQFLTEDMPPPTGLNNPAFEAVAPGIDTGNIPSDIGSDAPNPTPPVMGLGLSDLANQQGDILLNSPEQILGGDTLRGVLSASDAQGGGDLSLSGFFGTNPENATTGMSAADIAQAGGSATIDSGTTGAGGDFSLTKASSGAFGLSPLQGLGLLGLGGSLLMGNRGSPFGNTLGDVGSFQVQQARDVLNTALQGKLNPSQIDAFNQAFAQGKARVDQQFRAMGRDPAADSSYIGALDNLHQQLMAQFIQQATTQALQEMSVADAALANAARFQIAQDESFRRALQGAATALARMGGGGG